MTRDDYLNGWRTIARHWRLPDQSQLAAGCWNDDENWLKNIPPSALYDAIEELENEHKTGTYPRPVELHQKLRRHRPPPPKRADADRDADAAIGRRSLDPRAYPISPRARPVILKRDGSGEIDDELTAIWRERNNR